MPHIRLKVLVLIAVIVVGYVGWTHTRPSLDGQGPARPVTIRFAHTHLEGSVREAFDRLAGAYTALHPDVKVEQLAIPERIFDSWAQTQLVGGMAPDIIQLAGGIDREKLARFFVPLSEAVAAPNAYNHGTALADVPWRETFTDGLTSSPAFQPRLQEIYGVPNSMFTYRVYYNRDLYLRLVGTRALPTTFEAFIDLLADFSQAAAAEGKRMVPLAGSRFNAPFVLEALYEGQTQKLTRELNVSHHLLPDLRETILGHLGGRWDLDHPSVRSGFRLMREMGQRLSPGFMQLNRDDALFQFLQGQAGFIVSGSWDAQSIRSQATFPVGVFTLPQPDPGDPRYAAHMIGPVSESATQGMAVFGLTRQSKHQDKALDFLRFLTSVESNRAMTRDALWLPAVIGVETAEEMQPFLPKAGGYPAGMPFTFGPETERLVAQSLHLLFQPTDDSIDAFVAALKPGFKRAMRRDLERIVTSAWRNVAEVETAAGAWFLLSATDENALRRYGDLMETANAMELLNQWTRSEEDRIRRSRP